MLRRMKAAWKQRMIGLEQLTLQKRLVISYVLIILLPSILISLYIFNEFYGNYIKEIEKKNENAIEIEQVHIKNNIETMKRVSQLTEFDQEVLDFLSSPVEPSTAYLIDFSDKTMKKMVLRLQYNNPSIEHIRVYTSNKHLYELWPVFMSEKRIVEMPWYESVMAAGEQDQWEYNREDRDSIRNQVNDENIVLKPKISLLQGINYPNHVGILQVDMLLANFFPNTFSPLQDGQSQMLIMDRNGHFYSYPDNPFMANTGLTETLIKDQFLINNIGLEQKGSFHFNTGGIPFLCVYSYITQLDTYMLNVVSLENVYRDINKTRNQIIIANIILIAILSISTYKLNAIILKKLHVLTNSMKKVRQGDFKSEIAIRGGGEVGELAHHFRKMLKKINELIADAVHKQAASKEAELTTLRNQIDSHFLYNTLENIKMMAEINNQPDISDALTSLGGMMRYNTKWSSEFVRLRDEIIHINNYAAIINLRFENRVKLVIAIPQAFLSQEILKMSLQPIVENAVKHGLRDREMTITIGAQVNNEVMRIEIADDGAGLSKVQTDELNRRIALEEERQPQAESLAISAGVSSQGSGIGLLNVQRRIRMNYGREYGLQIESLEGQFTRVVIQIPYILLSGGLS
jgi:two-component system sensor histidine kinase YesM